jgi:hypothetical protein
VHARSKDRREHAAHIHEQEPKDGHDVQVDLAQELLLGCRVDVVCDVRVHLADVQWKLEANKLLCESNRNNGAER